MRYELKIQLSTELEIEAVKKALMSVEKSGKVEVHWMRHQGIGAIGRPNEVKKLILGTLSEVDYPRSAKQIGSALEKSPTSLYRILYDLVAKGELEFIEDKKWKVKRFGTPAQVKKWHERETKRGEKAMRRFEIEEGLGKPPTNDELKKLELPY